MTPAQLAQPDVGEPEAGCNLLNGLCPDGRVEFLTGGVSRGPAHWRSPQYRGLKVGVLDHRKRADSGECDHGSSEWVHRS